MKFILQDDYKDITLIRGDNSDYLLYSTKDEEDIFGFDNFFAESLANALLDDLGKGWKKYPENKPEEKREYQVTFMDMVDKNTWVSKAAWELYEKEKFSLTDGEYKYTELTCHLIKIIAYRELPAPFQPEEK